MKKTVFRKLALSVFTIFTICNAWQTAPIFTDSIDAAQQGQIQARKDWAENKAHINIHDSGLEDCLIDSATGLQLAIYGIATHEQHIYYANYNQEMRRLCIEKGLPKNSYKKHIKNICAPKILFETIKGEIKNLWSGDRYRIRIKGENLKFKVKYRTIDEATEYFIIFEKENTDTLFFIAADLTKPIDLIVNKETDGIAFFRYKIMDNVKRDSFRYVSVDLIRRVAIAWAF